jgi:hypothetical protein
MFDKRNLDNAFLDMARAAAILGKHVTLRVFGGSALVLGTTCRATTKDIDVIISEPSLCVQQSPELSAEWTYLYHIKAMIEELFPPMPSYQDRDWLHIVSDRAAVNATSNLFRPYANYICQTEGTGLSVWVATPEMVLATKALSIRNKDILDAAKLCWMIGIFDEAPLERLIEKHAQILPNLIGSIVRKEEGLLVSSFWELFDTVAQLRNRLGEAARPKQVTPTLQLFGLPLKVASL